MPEFGAEQMKSWRRRMRRAIPRLMGQEVDGDAEGLVLKDCALPWSGPTEAGRKLADYGVGQALGHTAMTIIAPAHYMQCATGVVLSVLFSQDNMTTCRVVIWSRRATALQWEVGEQLQWLGGETKVPSKHCRTV